MKTMKTIFAAMLAILSTSVAMASGNLKVNLASNETESAVVEITNTKMVNYEIQLFDEKSNLIYSMETEVPREDFTKRYDLSQLENGNYLYIVKTNNEKVTKQLAIDGGKVQVLDVRKTLEPYISREDDMIKLSYLNFGNENVKMYVYAADNTLLAENELGNEFAIHKGINVSDLLPGTYELILTNDQDVFHHTVEID